MMSPTTLRLVLLVACAHALVHLYELSLPSVEQQIAQEWLPHDEQQGKRLTGLLATCWRLPWGLGALAAGWLVDCYGARRMLALYLLGCAAMCGLAGLLLPLPLLFVTMFAMGTFASIYHPAGLALISYETTAENRPRALGLHGIFGSLGIGSAPFLAGVLLTAGFTWRQYYWVLALPGAVLGVVFLWQAARCRRDPPSPGSTIAAATAAGQPQAHWPCFFLLTVLALMQGFIYSALLSFLPRYLSQWQPTGLGLSPASLGSYLASGVLLAGCVGQYLAGRIARPALLERQLALVTFANAPLLLWMAFAQQGDRVLAAALFAVVHFMHQPLYNSLIAKYTPRHRRSLCYGFSFAMGLGIGSFGATFAGFTASHLATHTTLAAVALAAGCVGLLLRRWQVIADDRRSTAATD